MKNLYFIFASAILVLSACKKDKEDTTETDDPVVGDANIAAPSFSSSYTVGAASGSQYYPFIFSNASFKALVWGENTTPRTIKMLELDQNYQAVGNASNVVDDCGNINDADSYNQTIAYDPTSTLLLSVYAHSENNTSTAQKDFSLKGKLYNPLNLTNSSFYIEGPFDYANERPNRPSVATNGQAQFAVVYHSDEGFSNNSVIKLKLVDAAGNVTPADSSGTQTGFVLSNTGAQFAKVAFNSNQNLYGVVYTKGTGTAKTVYFLTFDGNGTVITQEKKIINTGSTAEFPIIKEDGDGFVIAWRDYRFIKIGENTGVTGMPSIRIARISSTGTLINANGATDIFSSTDQSLLVSNPYENGAYLHFDLVVVAAGQKYGLVWATQDAPYEIQFSEVQISGTNIAASIPKTLSASGVQSDKPTIAYANGKYIIAYQGHTGTSYENRLVVSQ